MKALYRKKKNNTLAEVVIVERKLTDLVYEVIIYTSDDNKSRAKVVSMKTVSINEYEDYIAKIANVFEDYGFKEDYDLVINNPFNTYSDGSVMPSRITQHLDSIENLTYPLYVREVSGVFYEFYFNGKLYIDNKHVLHHDQLSELNRIYDTLRVPFIGYIKDNEIIIDDVMLINTDYAERRNVLSIIQRPNTDKEIESEEELNKFLSEDSFYKKVTIKQNNSRYIPGFSMDNAWLFNLQYGEYRVLSIDATTKKAICINENLDIKEVEPTKYDYVSRIIRVNEETGCRV